MTRSPDPTSPSHSIRTTTPSADEVQRMTSTTKQGAASWGCLFVMCFGAVWLLSWAGGWIASFVSDAAVRAGSFVGAVLAVLVFIAVARSFAPFSRRETARAKAGQAAGVVEEIRVQAGRAVRWEGLHSSMDPTVCIDIGGGRLLLLLGQWMWDEATFGVPGDEGLEPSDEAAEKYVNGLPPPWSFPATRFTVRRVPATGHVLSIKIEGEYLQPAASALDLEQTKLDVIPASAVLEGTLDDLGAALRRASPPLFDSK